MISSFREQARINNASEIFESLIISPKNHLN